METLFVKSSTNSPRRYFQHTISAEPNNFSQINYQMQKYSTIISVQILRNVFGPPKKVLKQFH